jgi:hypothetical protein
MKTLLIIFCSFSLVFQANGQNVKYSPQAITETTAQPAVNTNSKAIVGYSLLSTGVVLIISGMVFTFLSKRQPLIHPGQYKRYDDYVMAINHSHKSNKAKELNAIRFCLSGLAFLIAGFFFIL